MASDTDASMRPDPITDTEKTALFLAQEYLALQKAVEDLDGRALTIKAWSVTFSAAAIGLAYVNTKPILLLVAAGSALVFWLVEAVWKYHQRAFYPRLFAIEAWFRDCYPAGPPFQTLSSWRSEFAGGWADWVDTRGKWWKGMLVPVFLGVMLPHAVVAVAAVALFYCKPPG